MAVAFFSSALPSCASRRANVRANVRRRLLVARLWRVRLSALRMFFIADLVFAMMLKVREKCAKTLTGQEVFTEKLLVWKLISRILSPGREGIHLSSVVSDTFRRGEMRRTRND